MTSQPLKDLLLSIYERRQRQTLAEFGGDEEEVQKRVGRMRAFCEAPAPGAKTQLYGKPKFERLPGAPPCEACGGAGLYWSQNSTPGKQKAVVAPGFVVCTCPAGKRKNEAIREHGRLRATVTRGKPREEF